MHGLSQPTRQLVSQQDAAMIENARIPRSTFNNMWTLKTSFYAGGLFPIMVDELVPGDHVKYDTTAFIRIGTLLYPMFDNQRVDTFFFFVPARLVWENWVRMMGEQNSPSDPIAFTVPVVQSPVNGFTPGTLADYFGIPTSNQQTAGTTKNVNALPFRAYNLIWALWFRDENLQGAVLNPVNDGPDSSFSYNIMVRAKSADYFTSALPWPQKFTAPSLPIGGLAPVIGIGFGNGNFPIPGPVSYTTTIPEAPWTWAKGPVTGSPADVTMFVKGGGNTGSTPQIYADLSAATGTTINQLRQAWMIQSLLERDARGGTRYTEIIRSHFDVINPDFRLQRPEYIGGGQSPLQVTPVAQTAPTEGNALGVLGAAGTAAGTHRASYAATEHGYVIGLINVKSEISYQQGLHRMWTRQSRYDFYWPALSQLGEQAIRNDEIYMTGTGGDLSTFGYQERWMEYRTRTSMVTSRMRSQFVGTLDGWHLAQNFASLPALNGVFIQDVPPMGRVLAGGEQATQYAYLADIQFRRTITRPMPTYGTPAILGRF